MKMEAIGRIMLHAQSIHLIKKLLQWQKLVLLAQLNKPYLGTSLPPSTLRHQTHHTLIPHQLTPIHLSQLTQSAIILPSLRQPTQSSSSLSNLSQPTQSPSNLPSLSQPTQSPSSHLAPWAPTSAWPCMATILVHHPTATCRYLNSSSFGVKIPFFFKILISNNFPNSNFQISNFQNFNFHI